MIDLIDSVKVTFVVHQQVTFDHVTDRDHSQNAGWTTT